MNTIKEDFNNINKNISTKTLFIPEQYKKKEITKINKSHDTPKSSINEISLDKKFKSLIAEQRDNFVVYLNKLSENSKEIIRNYIRNSFSNKYMKYDNLEKKKNI